MSSLLLQTVQLIIHFRYGLLFPAVIIEGPIATIIAGLLTAHGQLGFAVSYLVVVVADTVADLGYYAIGAFGKTKISQRLRPRIGITPERLSALRTDFLLHGWKAFLTGKILHGPGIAILVAAGAARVPLPRFLGYNVTITLVKSLVFLLIGYYFGQALGLFKQYLDLYALLASGVVVIIVTTFLIKKISRKNNNENSDCN